MKKLVAAAAATALSASLLLSSCSQNAPPVPSSLKVLFIGNSFACDTMEHVADIAKDLGVEEIKLHTLYIGGCSIRKHYQNLQLDLKNYELFSNEGDGWTRTTGHGIAPSIQSDDWDVIAIQHGTADGSLYAEQASYDMLPALVKEIKALASDDTKLVFNMTWVGNANSHKEMIAFGNNRKRYYQAVADLTAQTVVPIEGIDIVSPTGTAIENARSASLGYALHRDGYHLSYDIGRYIAGLTFFKAITGADISKVSWTPSGLDETGDPMQVDEQGRLLAIEAATNAIAVPFTVTPSAMKQESDT